MGGFLVFLVVMLVITVIAAVGKVGIDTSKDKKKAFYYECVRMGYTNMADKAHRLEAKEIAKKHGCRFISVKSLFLNVKEEIEAKERLRQRLQVDGTLFMTVYDYLSGENEGKEIAFYRRPDKSIYYKENGGVKQEGRPTFSVENAHTVFYNYHEGKVVYTGATVGGITTGGFHTEAPYMSEHKQYTGKGEIIVSYGGKRFEAKRVKFSSDMAEKFRREMGTWMFSVTVKGNDFLLVKSSIQENQQWQSLMNNFDSVGQYSRLEQFSSAKVDTLYEKETCRKIAEALNRTLL